MIATQRPRVGNWLPSDNAVINQWIKTLGEKARKEAAPLVKSIADFKAMVEQDKVLAGNIDAMFAEAYERAKTEPTGAPEVQTFDQFLQLLNAIMTTAPEYIECEENGEEEPCGLIGFPINALLDWPMATDYGYDVFSNNMVNQQLKRILSHWSEYLVTEASRYVLVESKPNATPKVIPWLSETARKQMVSVACQGAEDPGACSASKQFQDFFVCDPSDPYYGYKSWDDFFTRKFVDGVRPVASQEDDSVIVNACESAPYRIVSGIPETDEFWLKGQKYSLLNMLAWDPDAHKFKNGTVYQAFLSALSYHRWHSPVKGTIKQAYVVDGTYYLENQFQGFGKPGGPDPSAPNDSQGFITSVATRALIFIEADNPDIGLMCFVAVGMAEVSSCEITVDIGQRIKKGDELGMFHFGGSTHCLVFREETKLNFDLHGQTPGLDATNIPINSHIATVEKSANNRSFESLLGK